MRPRSRGDFASKPAADSSRTRPRTLRPGGRLAVIWDRLAGVRALASDTGQPLGLGYTTVAYVYERV